MIKLAFNFVIFCAVLVAGYFGYLFYRKKKGKPITFKPETDKAWTTIYYGARGACKSLHQGLEVEKILAYLAALYAVKPQFNRAIVLSNQKFNIKIEEKYPDYLYYWDEIEELQFCPRKKCWKKGKHRLHGAYVIVDDMAAILPAGNQAIPIWLKKLFSQGRHFGVRFLANCQDPFSLHIDFRRYCDRAYKFTKLFGNADPDETKKPIKFIFGAYRRRMIDADILWRYGDLPEQTIRLLITQRDEENERLKEMGREFDQVYDDSWKGSYHLFNKTGVFMGVFKIAAADTYDTLQDVKEFRPLGFKHSEIKCLDAMCDHVSVRHELV